jgi:single-stranded DNA-binding protein
MLEHPAIDDMASINMVILIGNLCADPEIRTMPDGDSICAPRALPRTTALKATTRADPQAGSGRLDSGVSTEK